MVACDTAEVVPAVDDDVLGDEEAQGEVGVIAARDARAPVPGGCIFVRSVIDTRMRAARRNNDAR